MDPTKSFDHLDPKLKETYARVMGTSTSGNSDTATPQPPATAQQTQPSVDQTPPATPSPADFSQPQPAFNQDQLSSSPFNTSVAQMPAVSNPGIAPINTFSTDTPTATAPAIDTPLSAMPVQNSTSPSSASFFSNPSPAINEPAQTTQPAMPDQNQTIPAESPIPSTPVTPYTAEDSGENQEMSQSDQITQPLPSPSSISQTTPHEASALLRVLYIVGAVIFFAVYTFFWIKVFGLPIPFLTP